MLISAIGSDIWTMKLVQQRCGAGRKQHFAFWSSQPEHSHSSLSSLFAAHIALVVIGKMAETEVRQQLQRLQVRAGRGMSGRAPS
jgi:hypothetical protein